MTNKYKSREEIVAIKFIENHLEMITRNIDKDHPGLNARSSPEYRVAVDGLNVFINYLERKVGESK